MNILPSDQQRRRSAAKWALRGIVVLPIVVAIARALLNGWFPVGDNALLAVRANDVATGHHPWLGSWTSASLALGTDVNNPGPLYSDLIAPFMWTIGRLFGTGAGVAVGVGSVNIAAACGSMFVGHKMDGWRGERWALLMVAAMTWTMGSELLIDIWQPHALLLPFCLLLLVTAAVQSGRLTLVPLWLVVASVILQTHVAYVYIVVTLGALLAVSLVRALLARATGESLLVRARVLSSERYFRISVAVITIAWVQPIVEQFFGRGQGNLQRLATNASGGDSTLGPRLATKIVAAVVALPPWWVRSGFVGSVESTPLTQTPDGAVLEVLGLPIGVVAAAAMVALIAVIVGLLVVLRGNDSPVSRSVLQVALVGVLVALAGLSIQAVTTTGLGSHQIRWLFALAVFVQISIAWGLTDLVRARWTHRADGLNRRLNLALAVATGGLAVANLPFTAHDLGPTADRDAAATLQHTFIDLETFQPRDPIIYDTDNVRVFEPYSSAVIMRLDELGVEIRFAEEGLVRQYGEGRRASGGERIHIRQFEGSEALLYLGPACTLSLASGMAADVEEQADALIAAAANDLADGTRSANLSGVPDEVARIVRAAVEGDQDAAFRVVADGFIPFLMTEDRIESTDTIQAAVENATVIAKRVNSTLLITATTC